jgi:hypothetical protein
LYDASDASDASSSSSPESTRIIFYIITILHPSVSSSMRVLVTTLLVQLFLWTVAAHTQNYNILAAAALKKSAPAIEVGKSYLLIEVQGFHHKIIVGTVTDNNGERDYEASMTQLVKDNSILSGRELSDYCSLVGNPCDTQPREAYRCGQSNSAPQKYKFSGEAKPEFADPGAFHAWGTSFPLERVEHGANR